MLVLVPGQVVLAVLVSPVDSRRKVLLRNGLPSVWGVLDWAVGELGLLNSASARCVLVEHALKSKLNASGVLGLRELIDGEVVLWIVLLSVRRSDDDTPGSSR